MSPQALPIITLPTTDGNHTTSRVKHRGTKTPEEFYAEMGLRIGNQPLTIPLVLQTHDQVIVDWTVEGWKIAPLGDGLISYLCSSGGSAPIGQEPTKTFEGLCVELRGHYTEAGRARAAAQFSAEKVGEQNRVTPIFLHVYDSASKLPNHYVAMHGLTLVLGNRRIIFDPTNENHRIRFQKQDGTWVVAASYPYIKGSTIVCLPPAGLTGEVILELTLQINGALRTGLYAFPLA